MSDNSGSEDLSDLVGEILFDVENETRVFVVELLDDLADEYIVMYNYDKSPKFVSDFESNEDYPEDDQVVNVVYVDSFPEGVDVRRGSLDRVEGLVEDHEIRLYPLPVSRVVEVPEEFSEE